MAQKLLLIATDCGIDDAQAVMVALAQPNVKVLGITCCFYFKPDFTLWMCKKLRSCECTKLTDVKLKLKQYKQ